MTQTNDTTEYTYYVDMDGSVFCYYCGHDEEGAIQYINDMNAIIECASCDRDIPYVKQRKATTLIEKLKAGQRVFVENPDTGKKFSIEPAYWEGIRLGWTFRNEAGDISPQHNGIMVEDADIKDCCEQLVERAMPGVVVEWKTAAMKAPAFWYYHTKCLPEKYRINGKDVRFVELNGVSCIGCNELI